MRGFAALKAAPRALRLPQRCRPAPQQPPGPRRRARPVPRRCARSATWSNSACACWRARPRRCRCWRGRWRRRRPRRSLRPSPARRTRRRARPPGRCRWRAQSAAPAACRRTASRAGRSSGAGGRRAQAGGPALSARRAQGPGQRRAWAPASARGCLRARGMPPPQQAARAAAGAGRTARARFRCFPSHAALRPHVPSLPPPQRPAECRQATVKDGLPCLQVSAPCMRLYCGRSI